MIYFIALNNWTKKSFQWLLGYVIGYYINLSLYILTKHQQLG